VHGWWALFKEGACHRDMICVLLCVAMCCCVVLRVAVCCYVLLCVSVCCCVAVCCSKMMPIAET